jgi:hypothetical protein
VGGGKCHSVYFVESTDIIDLLFDDDGVLSLFDLSTAIVLDGGRLFPKSKSIPARCV